MNNEFEQQLKVFSLTFNLNCDNVIDGDNIDFFCLICHNFSLKPVSLDCCGKIFCDKCLRCALLNSAKCPACRADVISEKSIIYNPYVAQKIFGMMVRCPNDNCDAKMMVGKDWKHITKHYFNECMFSHGECSGCDKEFVRSDYLTHIEMGDGVCPDKIVTCDICKIDLKYLEYQVHKKSADHLEKLETEYTIVTKENDGLSILLKDFEDVNKKFHLDNQKLQDERNGLNSELSKYLKYTDLKDSMLDNRLKFLRKSMGLILPRLKKISGTNNIIDELTKIKKVITELETIPVYNRGKLNEVVTKYENEFTLNYSYSVYEEEGIRQ